MVLQNLDTSLACHDLRDLSSDSLCGGAAGNIKPKQAALDRTTSA